MVYSSNEKLGHAVRLFQNGLLRTGPNFPGHKPSLPVDDQFLVACPNTQDYFLCEMFAVMSRFTLRHTHPLAERAQ